MLKLEHGDHYIAKEAQVAVQEEPPGRGIRESPATPYVEHLVRERWKCDRQRLSDADERAGRTEQIVVIEHSEADHFERIVQEAV